MVLFDIFGYEGLYRVSDDGRVWSVKSNRWLTPCPDRKGYMIVGLCADSVLRTFRVHRLVAQAFLPNPEGLPQVNHKDEDKTNNDVSNLEWCTNEYNEHYGTRVERIVASNITNGHWDGRSKNKKKYDANRNSQMFVKDGVILPFSTLHSRKDSNGKHYNFKTLELDGWSIFVP